jgi:hypothetical protein
MERPEAPPLLGREAGMPRKRSQRAGAMGAMHSFLRPAKGVSQTPWRLRALHIACPAKGGMVRDGKTDGAPGAGNRRTGLAERWLELQE